MVRFLAERLPDGWDARWTLHSQGRLAQTLLLLAGQGRPDHSDATERRRDPALRLETSDRAGTAPLGPVGRRPSQPTLSRRVAEWSAEEGVEVLREGLQRLPGRRLKAMDGWRGAPEKLVIDIDSLSVEVHGEQPGQRVERILPQARVPPDHGVGRGDGRHAGPAAARGAGAHGGRRAGVRANKAGSCYPDSMTIEFEWRGLLSASLGASILLRKSPRPTCSFHFPNPSLRSIPTFPRSDHRTSPCRHVVEAPATPPAEDESD